MSLDEAQRRLEVLQEELRVCVDDTAEAEILCELINLGCEFPDISRAETYAEHVARLIELEPCSLVLWEATAFVEPTRATAAYERGCSAYRRHLAARRRDVSLALAAARFIGRASPEEAESLLQRFSKYKRRGPEVCFAIARLPLPPARRLSYLDRARAGGYRGAKRCVDFAWVAYWAGDLERARSEAAALISTPPTDAAATLPRPLRPSDASGIRALANAITLTRRHHGHIVLGLIAAEESALETAAEHLISAAPPSSALMVSYGDALPLITTLCRAGHWTAVETYLGQLVAAEPAPDSAAKWLLDVRERRIPEARGAVGALDPRT